MSVPSADPSVRAAPTAESAQTGGELLTTFLSSDTLLWGCIAMGLIALVTVSRVASRRRKAGKDSRLMRAQSDAVHEFLRMVREGHKAADQGVWHYEFSTGSEQFTDEFRSLVGGEQGEIPEASEVAQILREVGVDLAKLARNNFEETEPYEVEFSLSTQDGKQRAMLLMACNMRNGAGEVQRLVAVLREAANAH
ncbi:MAG: hypothetical protein AAFY42_05880 [Pseudomonadota bacterium]